METRYIALLSYGDGSAAIQAFGPYATEVLAKDAIANFQAWPALSAGGRWEVLPCVDTAASACGHIADHTPEVDLSDRPCVLPTGHPGAHMSRDGGIW